MKRALYLLASLALWSCSSDALPRCLVSCEQEDPQAEPQPDLDKSPPPSDMGPDLAEAGLVRFAKQFGGLGVDQVLGSTVLGNADGDSDLILCGTFSGTVDFGGGPLMSLGDQDAFVVRISRDGKHRWSRRFGGPGFDAAYGVSRVPGGLLVGGAFEKSMDVGAAQPLRSAGGFDAFVVRLDLSGQVVWSRRFGGPEDDAVSSVSQGGGALWASGYITGPVDLGAGALAGMGGRDGFLLRLSGTGEPLSGFRMGGPKEDQANKVVVTERGEAWVVGTFQGTAAFGETQLASAGKSDLFVGLYPTTVSVGPQFVRRFGGQGEEDPRGLALLPDGDVAVVGAYSGAADLGGGALPGSAAGGFLARYGVGGVYRFARAFTGPAPASANTVAVATNGDLLVGGSANSVVDLGRGWVGEGGAWYARFNGLGGLRYGRPLPGTGNLAVMTVSADERGVVFGGEFTDLMGAEGARLLSTGASDIFLVGVDP